jgi:hypothetical protein
MHLDAVNIAEVVVQTLVLLYGSLRGIGPEGHVLVIRDCTGLLEVGGMNTLLLSEIVAGMKQVLSLILMTFLVHVFARFIQLFMEVLLSL